MAFWFSFLVSCVEDWKADFSKEHVDNVNAAAHTRASEVSDGDHAESEERRGGGLGPRMVDKGKERCTGARFSVEELVIRAWRGPLSLLFPEPRMECSSANLAAAARLSTKAADCHHMLSGCQQLA